jgi:hypothetical protein
VIAALFVQADGVYANRIGIDAWPESRDARTYAGPHPVVAHPPCQLWGKMAAVNYARYGGEHNRPGNDGGCFAAALRSVRTFGGVLEHPAGSAAWDKFGLPRPSVAGWRREGIGTNWTCEVWQSAYGHKARKRTWLLYVGLCSPPEMRWDRVPGSHQIGWPGPNAKFHGRKTLGKKAASATPPAFADALIALAQSCERAEASK